MAWGDSPYDVGSQPAPPANPNDPAPIPPGGGRPGLTMPQVGQVSGPWGATIFPQWFLQGIAGSPMLQQNPEAAANLFADYVSQNPTIDFGQYWNQFKAGSPLGDRGARFGTGAPGHPTGPAPASPPPGPNDQGAQPPPGGDQSGNTVGQMSSGAPRPAPQPTPASPAPGVVINVGAGGNQPSGRVQQANRNSIQRPPSPATLGATVRPPAAKPTISPAPQPRPAPMPPTDQPVTANPSGSMYRGTATNTTPRTGINDVGQRRLPLSRSGGFGSNY